ncbi:PREDICTED: uncharacterized protein LOC105449848 isoform X2 [Wasmannia auropunctata]|uniref:uncharacterized protein LOC105449848 isoform X2 n=1 Tax=Wasmannia auropunctata TaxID=64793 RepID=UPI0005EF5A53|nr:PREDICTED: uncharacterized protein LOC105449848 isoform X2 [Wasmannia auropunctata]
MSRVCVSVCLFVLFTFSDTLLFSDYENNSIQSEFVCENISIIPPGSNKTRLTFFETLLKGMMLPVNILEKIFKNLFEMLLKVIMVPINIVVNPIKNLLQKMFTDVVTDILQSLPQLLTRIIINMLRPKNYTKHEDHTQLEKGGNMSYGKVLTRYKNYVNIVYPGTLWCGPGNNAINESDLGQFNETDACCRAHDECKDYLLVGETKVNIQNNGVFTRSACTCDNEFYDCLKNVSSLISLKISVMYFNILQPQCFQCVCLTS